MAYNSIRMKTLTVAGYHGIMDLDLSVIDPIHRPQAIHQHKNDIALYCLEQSRLKPEHRYENTIIRINKQQEYAKQMQLKRKNNIIYSFITHPHSEWK